MDKNLKNKKQKVVKEKKKNSVPTIGKIGKKKNENPKQKDKGKQKKKPVIPSKNIEEIKKEFENNDISNNNLNKSLRNFNTNDNSEK